MLVEQDIILYSKLFSSRVKLLWKYELKAYVARPLIHAFSLLFLNGISISFPNPGGFLPAATTAVWEMFQFLELFLLKE